MNKESQIKKKEYYIVIPVYNEEKSLPYVLKSIKHFMPFAGVLVIDDGSQDRSYKIARDHGVSVVRLHSNKGSGFAVRAGLRRIINKAKNVVLLDGDGQHDPKEIPRLLRQLNTGSDMVIASRYIHGGGGGSTVSRKIGTFVLSYALWWIYKKRMYDPTSGFRALSGKTLKLLVSRYPTTFSEPESIVMALDHRLIVKEISTTMRKRKFGSSSISFLKACMLMGYMLSVLFQKYKSRASNL